ncbi:MAG TPA: hypothetical protein VF743_08415, partial [Acidimicrobiales bacterium]
MAGSLTDRFARLGSQNAQLAVLGCAAAVVLAVSAVLVAVGVDNVEIIATVLVVPVFAVALYLGRLPGLAAGALATGVYGVLRRPDLDATGAASFGVLIVTRAVAYGIVAYAGAWVRDVLAALPAGDAWDDEPRHAHARRRAVEVEPVPAMAGAPLDAGLRAGGHAPGGPG